MTVTLERLPITSQLTFDSYVGDWAAFALRLINELTATHAHGRPNFVPATPAAQLNAIRAVAADMGRLRLRSIDLRDATAMALAVAQLRAAVDECVSGRVSQAADILNDVMTASNATPNLHGEHGGPLVFAFHVAGQPTGESSVADMAASIALIIGSGREGRLRQCGASACDQVFYDTTRNASRRFCELSCQNRAKAVAYRARQAT